MLSKQNRADKKAIEQIFKEGRFLSSANLSFRFIKNPASKITRISFITPKTVAKSAVTRNLLRRRGYSALKPYLSSFPAGVVGAFIFGKKASDLFGKKKATGYDGILSIQNEIKTILSKLN